MNDIVPRRNVRRRAFNEALLKFTKNKKELKNLRNLQRNQKK